MALLKSSYRQYLSINLAVTLDQVFPKAAVQVRLWQCFPLGTLIAVNRVGKSSSCVRMLAMDAHGRVDLDARLFYGTPGICCAICADGCRIGCHSSRKKALLEHLGCCSSEATLRKVRHGREACATCAGCSRCRGCGWLSWW